MFYNCFLCRYQFSNEDNVLIADCGHFCCVNCAPDVTYVLFKENIQFPSTFIECLTSLLYLVQTFPAPSCPRNRCNCNEGFVIADSAKPIRFEKAVALQTNILLTKLICQTTYGLGDVTNKIGDLELTVGEIDYKVLVTSNFVGDYFLLTLIYLVCSEQMLKEINAKQQ